MNKEILKSEVQQFIDQHLNDDLSVLVLKGSPFMEVSVQELAQQIESKAKAKKKLPHWYETSNIYYPPKLSLEQCSSLLTADYKASLVGGRSLIDISGGMGVDALAFAQKCEHVVHCELNESLSALTAYNLPLLGGGNVDCYAGDGIGILKDLGKSFDWIFADPSRRDEGRQRVFMLSDCLPDIPANLDLLFAYSDNILLKLSPLLDITNALRELPGTKEVHILSVKNDCKELLFVLKKNYHGAVKIKTLNIHGGEHQVFDFVYGEQPGAENYGLAHGWIYEPNASLMKSGAFHLLTKYFPVQKLAKHSHFYTSEQEIKDFPGRRFKIREIIPFDKKRLLKLLPHKKANITARNFSMDVASIRKKTGIKEGGDDYLFFSENAHGKRMVVLAYSP